MHLSFMHLNPVRHVGAVTRIEVKRLPAIWAGPVGRECNGERAEKQRGEETHAHRHIIINIGPAERDKLRHGREFH